MFDKSKTLLNWRTYHRINHYDGLVVFKENTSVQEIDDWLVEFQNKVDKVYGNQHLQFTAEVLTTDYNLPSSEKKYWIQILTNDAFSFLGMKMSWSSERGLQFGVLRENVQQLKYIGMRNIHIPSTLYKISSGTLNCLAKLALRKTSFCYERVDNVYPENENTVCKAGLATKISPKRENYGKV